MISYLCRALRLSQIVLNVGAAAAVAGFFADFAVGGGLVGLAFFGLFNVKVSVKVSGKVSSGTTPFADPRACHPIPRALYCTRPCIRR